MDSKTTLQYNKLIQLENSMLMYHVYNAETLEKLIDTVHQRHNTTSSHESLFVGQQSSLTLKSLYTNALGLQHYSINSLLYLRTVPDKSIALYKEMITQLHIYTTSKFRFKFYYNKTDIAPTVLDGGNKIILVNCPNDKHIIYSINNDIPIKIPSHPYVLVNQSVLCNSGVETENHFLLEYLSAF